VQAHNIQPLLNKDYPIAVSAKGIFIRDKTGKLFIDGSSGAIACSLGHSHPRIISRIKSQSDKLQFVYRSQFGSDEAEKLASSLAGVSPEGVYAHAFFVNSGTEAIETAMKISWQYWQESGKPEKRHFITRRKSYHGITMGALSLSGHPLRRQRFQDLLEPYPALSADLQNDSVEIQMAELQNTIEQIGAEKIAAFVAEPVVGAAGAAIYPPNLYYEAVKKICEKNEILFIADEVMTGLGRTGAWFGLDHWRTHADVIAIGKSLGAGYAPIAATLMTEKILSPIKSGTGLIMSGHTYSGHPMSCAVAQEVMDVIKSENLIDQVGLRGKQLLDGLKELAGIYSVIGHVRGKGLMIGLEFFPELKGMQSKFIQHAFDEGLLVYPSVGGPYGSDENGILIAPPFIITGDETVKILEIINRVLKRLSS
jgi:adenosylmethionine-8-amino-7-oxononanoate aminotransferase